jgi:hypothetical protein
MMCVTKVIAFHHLKTLLLLIKSAGYKATLTFFCICAMKKLVSYFILLFQKQESKQKNAGCKTCIA